MPGVACCVCALQVAGRLHVEVWRGTEGSGEEGDSEPSGAQQDTADGEAQERKLECVVRTTQPRSLSRSSSGITRVPRKVARS